MFRDREAPFAGPGLYSRTSHSGPGGSPEVAPT